MRPLSAIALLLVGCGRLGFDGLRPRDDAPLVSGDSRGDGRTIDGMITGDAGLPAGLLAYYPLGDLAGITDDAQGANAGTCTVGQCPARTVAGHIGAGAIFDGIDDCIDVTDSGQLQLPQLTLAVWALQTGSGTLSHVSKKVAGGSVNSWQLETEALGMPTLSLSFTTYDNSGLNQYARTPMDSIVPNQWQHLAATYDGTTKRVYINGVEMASMPAPALPYDANPMKIGCDDNAPLGEFYAGTLDDLQIYDRALSAAEIAALAAR